MRRVAGTALAVATALAASRARAQTPASAPNAPARPAPSAAPAHRAAPAPHRQNKKPKPQLEVWVNGRRPAPPASSRDLSAASTVIRAADLKTPGATAAEVMARVPGVQIAETGAASDLATASIRGASSAETPVYLAGIRLNDDVTGTADLSTVPLWMIDRVEVFRGDAPADADRLGIGGAVFFDPKLPHRASVGGGFGAGSFGETSAFARAAVAGPGAASMIAVRRDSATNDYSYLDDAGTRFDTRDDRVVVRPNAGFSSYDAWAIGQSELGPGGARLTTVVNAFEREQGVTGLGVIPAHAARANVERELAGVTADVPCSRPKDGVSDCTLELSSTAITSKDAIRDPLNELGLLAPSVVNSGTRFSESAGVTDYASGALKLGARASQELEVLHVDSEGFAGLDARRAVTRLSASARYALTRRLDVEALGAVEDHSTAGPDAGDRLNALEPVGRAGARLRVARGVALLGNVGRYVRVPTLGELYGTSPVVRGNPSLAAERGVTADLGVRGATGTRALGAWIDAFGFLRSASDLIAFRSTGVGTIRPFNVGSARVLGAEIASGAVLVRHLKNALSLTLLDPRDTTPGRGLVNDILPFESRLVAMDRLELFSEPAWPAFALDRAGLAARLRYRSSRFADPAGLVVIDGQTLFDLELTLLFLRRRLAARFAVDDVFDAPHFDVVGFPLPGRSFHATFEATW
jgi:vitamin B12 transporter